MMSALLHKALPIILFVCYLFCSSSVWAEQSQFADSGSQKALSAIFAIDRTAFDKAVATVKDPAKAAFLKEYMTLMSYTAANSKKNFEAYIKAWDTAYDAAVGSHYEANLLCQLHVHKCMVYMYSGSMVSGGLQFWKSYRQFKIGEKTYPSYDGQLCFRGIYNILFSQIPEKWKSLSGFLGLGEGNLSMGFKQIEDYRQKVKQYSGLNDEALLFSFVNMFFSHDQNLSDELTTEIKKSNAAVVRYAYVLSCGRRQMGAEAEQTLKNTPDAVKDNFPLLYHQMGKYALRREQPDETIRWATKFLERYTGLSNQNNAYLEMAYAYLLKGNTAKAYKMADRCVSIKSEFDIDRRAVDEASKIRQKDVRMLRAALQFEYGFFEKSLSGLKTFTPHENDKEEYYFRMARAEQQLNHFDKAIAWYEKSISYAAKSKLYYGAYAAVYVADLKLSAGDTAAAKRYVELARTLNDGEYKKELDQRIELTTRAIQGKK